jgi:hypothetical protein
MTKRHFVFMEMAVYAHVQQLRDEGDLAGLLAIERFAETLCAAFKLQNPRFSRTAFMSHCGLAYRK